MFTFLRRRGFNRFFPHIAKCEIHRRQACYVRPTLEVLEDRLAPAAYTFTGGDPVSPQAWFVLDNWNNGNAQALPGPTDDVTIPTGKTAVLSGQSATVQSVTVSGTLDVQAALTVEVDGAFASGDTLVAAAPRVPNSGILVVGGSDPNTPATLDTSTLTDNGTVTVGGPSSVGSTATLDTVFANIGDTSGNPGLLNIGDPSSGMAGTVDVTKTLAVNSSGALNVGGAGGSGGTLDVQALTSAATNPGTFNVTVNSNGTIDVKTSATFRGDTAVTGVINAETIDGFTGASVTFAGAAAVATGPLTGNLNAEPNASFTFAPSSTVVLGTGTTLGDGQFFIDGPLTVDTALDASKPEFFLQSDGSTTAGSIGGSGSIDWWNNEFNWQGGTIGGLTGGGFTIDGNADFKLTGPNAKVLATTMTNTGSGTADFGGTGSLTITGPGMPAGTGALINDASAVLPMDLSLPVLAGAAGSGFTPGALTNYGYLDISGTSPMTISAPLVNTVGGVIDCATGAASLTLSDASGTSILNGKIGLNDDSLTISGLYTTTSGAFEEEYSPTDLTTLTGTLTIDSGASADFDHLVLTSSGGGSGGLITGAGDFSIDADGGGSNDYLTWTSGTMTGTGTTTIGPNATLTLSGIGTMGRDLDNHGKVVWTSSGAGMIYGSGVSLHNERDGVFDFESSAMLPTVTNDGLLELAAGATAAMATFTQSSTGTLQSDIASGSSWGKLSVTGSATLDGTLQAELENGYQPPSGTSFDVLDFASSSGQFATIDPQGWSATYNPTSVDLVSP